MPSIIVSLPVPILLKTQGRLSLTFLVLTLDELRLVLLGHLQFAERTVFRQQAEIAPFALLLVAANTGEHYLAGSNSPSILWSLALTIGLDGLVLWFLVNSPKGGPILNGRTEN